MPTMKKFLFTALALVLLTGMTKSPKSFQPLSEPSHFELAQDLSMPNKLNATLTKGRYQAVFQSKDHVFYLGAPKALQLGNGPHVSGGIALPKPDSKLSCHMFIQIGDDSKEVREQGMGPIVAALAKAEAGRIREFKKDPNCAGLMPHIQIINTSPAPSAAVPNEPKA